MDLTDLIARIRSCEMALVRTSFADDAAWLRVRDAALEPDDLDGSEDGPYEPNLDVVDDPRYDGLMPDVLAAAIGTEWFTTVAFADAEGMRDAADPTVLLLSLGDGDAGDDYYTHGQTFRTIVSEVASIEANLSIANMDFGEFAESVAPDGVFRGFGSE